MLTVKKAVGESGAKKRKERSDKGKTRGKGSKNATNAKEGGKHV
jgi:hypothetical protein